MASSKGSELINLLRAHQGAPAPDRSDARDEYLRAVEALYSKIREWLADAIEQGLAKVTAGGAITLREEGVEPYDAPVLFVEVGPKRIRFEPQGFQIVAANGRVNVDAGDRTAMLVLVKDDWSFARRTPKVQLLPLNEATFTEAMRELLGP